jgi:hypothetical protein
MGLIVKLQKFLYNIFHCKDLYRKNLSKLNNSAYAKIK